VTKRDKYEEGVRNLILAGVRSGEFAPCDPALAVRPFLGSLNWSIQWFSPEGPADRGGNRGEICRLLIRGLLAKQTLSSRSPWTENRFAPSRGSIQQNGKSRAVR